MQRKTAGIPNKRRIMARQSALRFCFSSRHWRKNEPHRQDVRSGALQYAHNRWHDDFLQDHPRRCFLAMGQPVFQCTS